jgi:prophage antirepressor-like protein
MWQRQKGVNMNDLQIFNNEEFGEVRTAAVNDEPMFCLADICRVLEIKNVSDCKSRLRQKGIVTTDTLTNGGKQKMIFIDESNLYKTIFQSRKESAERFTEWVTSEVLPSIRKTGSYSKPLTTSEQIRLLAQGNTELTERVDKVEDKITSIEEETPLYGCEIEEVQKHVRKKGIEVLGGKDSNAYKDGGIRGSVYSDIYKQLKREFGCVATYKSIKRKYLADVHEFIDTYLLPIALAEVVHDTNM